MRDIAVGIDGLLQDLPDDLIGCCDIQRQHQRACLLEVRQLRQLPRGCYDLVTSSDRVIAWPKPLLAPVMKQTMPVIITP